MPPYVPRKRLREASSPEPGVSAAPRTRGKAVTAPPRKPTLFDNLDGASTPGSSKRNRELAEQLDGSDSDSLTSLSDADFEDVPLAKRQKVEVPPDEDDDDDEDIEFEDVEAPLPTAIPDAPLPSGDLELTLTRDTRVSLVNILGKKGPSKLERKIRIATHCVHVQFLLWHNAIRNSWLCDPEVQGILMSHVPPVLWVEVDRWRRNSGLEVPEEKSSKPTKSEPTRAGDHARGQKGKDKGKSKGKSVARPARDWGDAAERLEAGNIDMSHGDPLFRLMKALAAWWKQRFRVNAPGIRKLGYMSLERLDRLTKAFNSEDHDATRFGERIRDLGEFRKCAQECAGSRDTGAQLFTALLRALGLEARMVANLQPLGFGWNKLEDADPEKQGYESNSTPKKGSGARGQPGKEPGKAGRTASGARKTPNTSRAASRSTREDPEEVGDGSDMFELRGDESESDSNIELPEAPAKRGKSYDKTLEFPHYWTEVLSPVTNKYLAVDPIVKFVIGTNRDKVESLEPRGAKADKAKQVIAYVVGFSPDGTAKDVTVRYLKRQMLPGRTKGIRMPIEKVPVYNQHGKVKRYEQFDWFQSVMKGYVRGSKTRPFTEVDYEEDATELKPAKPEKKEVKEGEETLQYYKQSKEFVLARHLKREEALLPTAVSVKTFKNKGKGSEATEELVYSRKDVVQVKSAETWHKQGREPIAGEEPLKRVPYRAATTNRRREIAEAERVTGEKVLQGLYSFDQTNWIIPAPIQDGIIPKNEYGNIDLFVEHMCPRGAVHVPYRGAVKVCKRLQIDYAEAVVDFEFGHRMAVPVIQGVVIAEEYHDNVMQELAKDEAERSRKEDEKRRKAAMGMWRKFLMGMRIVERIKHDYGHIKDDAEVFGRHPTHASGATHADEDDMAGGFLPDGYEEEKVEEAHQKSGFFPVVDEDEDDGENTLEIDHGYGGYQGEASSAQASEPSAPNTRPKRKAVTKAKAKATSSKRRATKAPSSEEDEDEEDDLDLDDFEEDDD